MADYATTYTLATAGGTIIFNNGSLNTTDDLYWIQTAPGLDGVQIRAPIDNVPLGDGGLVHAAWKAPRHFTLDGVIIVQSVSIGGPCLSVRNDMEENLRVAMESIIAPTSGTLSWTPTGQSSRTLTVYYELLDFSPAENYAVQAFVVGLVAGSPDWV